MIEFTRHLDYEVNDRGLKHMPTLSDGADVTVRVYESSAASQPRVWLAVTDYRDNERVSVQLTAQRAWELSEQLQLLVREHYQGDARPEWAFPDTGYRDAEGRPIGGNREGE